MDEGTVQDVVGAGKHEMAVMFDTCTCWGACELGDVVACDGASHSCLGTCCSGLVPAWVAARCECHCGLGNQVLVQGMRQDMVHLVAE